MKYFNILAVCSLLFWSCENNPKETGETETDSLSLTYSLDTFHQSWGDCQSDTSIYCTSVNFEYPIFEGNDSIVVQSLNYNLSLQFLRVYLEDSLNRSLSGYSSQFIEDYKQIKDRFDQAFGWRSELNSQVIRDDSIIVIKTITELYTGGAHGISNTHYLNMNSATGEILHASDIFKEKREEIQVMILDALAEKYKEITENVADPSEVDFVSLNNFGLLDSGVVFQFNAYDITPYAQGNLSVTITYEKISPYLNQ